MNELPGYDGWLQNAADYEHFAGLDEEDDEEREARLAAEEQKLDAYMERDC